MRWNACFRLLSALALLGAVAGAHIVRAGRGVALAQIPQELIPICQLQGAGFSTPYQGQTVTTQGLVYADLDETAQRGFYLQADPCDGDPLTSDGIFVYLGQRLDVVQGGDLVEVTGIAGEYYGMTEVVAAPEDVLVLSSLNPLPLPVELDPPFANDQARLYFERHEAMRVGLAQAAVVGPTSADDETWVVSANLGLERVFHDDPLGTGELVCVDDQGLYEITPEAAVGDQALGLVGALDYSFGLYRLSLTESPTLLPGSLPAGPTPVMRPGMPLAVDESAFTVATFNLENLFDTLDDPDTQDTVLSQAEYQRRLQKRALAIHADLAEPTLIAVQEVENLAVLQALADRPEIAAGYLPVWLDSPDIRGLDVALLYRSDQASLLSYHQEQGCTTLVDGLGPDGNYDLQNPQNALTCDSDGDGTLDGNRLFSRPPLLVELELSLPTPADAGGATQQTLTLWLVVSHWKSKVHDTPTQQYTLPRRTQQAQFVAGLVGELQEVVLGANILVLGDLNDNPDSEPLEIIRSSGLRDLTQSVARASRYSYIYQGISLQFDYIFAELDRGVVPVSAGFVHLNADYPAVYARDEQLSRRSSDHDPFLVGFIWHDHFLYLPIALAR